MLVGGIILAYTLIVGTMSTAHDGEMLGKSGLLLGFQFVLQ